MVNNTVQDTNDHKTAVLFIHGILGTPRQFDAFMPLVPKDWTVMNLTLKGHCSSVEAISKATMKDWKKQVRDAHEELCKTHDSVILVAHSMGTIFAIQDAVECPTSSIFIMNVPLCVRVTPKLIEIAWKISQSTVDRSNDREAVSEDMIGTEPDKNIFSYIRILPRYFELFREIRRTKGILQDLNVPCYAYLSDDDEMISLKTEKLLKKKTQAKVTVLKNASHAYYPPDQKDRMLSDFSRYIVKNEKQKYLHIDFSRNK